MTKLLIQEPPLQVLPKLAKAIGLNEAIVLQQLHYWLENTKTKGAKYQDEKWIYNSYKEWREDNFPFWSEHTIRRIFKSLEKQGLIIVAQQNTYRWDHTKYYRIDYEKLNEISSNLDTSSVQLGQTDVSNMDASSTTETTTEITAEITSTREGRERVTSSDSSKDSTSSEGKSLLFNGEGSLPLLEVLAERRVPEKYWPLFEVCVEHLGGCDSLPDWLKTFKEWELDWLPAIRTPENVESAFRYYEEKNASAKPGQRVNIHRPGSLTGCLAMIEGQRVLNEQRAITDTCSNFGIDTHGAYRLDLIYENDKRTHSFPG
jgi:hypothetical protein